MFLSFQVSEKFITFLDVVVDVSSLSQENISMVSQCEYENKFKSHTRRSPKSFSQLPVLARRHEALAGKRKFLFSRDIRPAVFFKKLQKQYYKV